MRPEKNVQLPNNYSGNYSSESPPYLYEKQKEVAERTLELILEQNSKKIEEHNQLEWFILMPYFKSLMDQTASRVKEWIHTIRNLQKVEDIDHSKFMEEVQTNDSRSYSYRQDYVTT